MAALLEGKEPIWLPLLSGSMAPALLPGDQLYIDPEKRDPRSGDVAVFFRDGLFFSHRVLVSFLWRRKRYILEKGDANRSASFISSDKVLGTVRKFSRDSRISDLTTIDAVKNSKRAVRQSFLHIFGLRRLY